MPRRIFFSWQADTPTSVGRNFLHNILESICRRISSDTTLDEAERDVEVDSDTRGVAGQPPIAETILAKIDNSAVVVADMTFTGKRLDGRPTPNPNVLIEYGWALKSLGYNRTVTVMNTFYGNPTREALPFDLAHLRWPMEYVLPPETEAGPKADERRRFGEQLERAIRACLSTVPATEVPSPPQFTEAAAKDGPGRFRAPDEVLGFDENIGARNAEVILASGSAMWLRLSPIVDVQKQWSAQEIRRLSEGNSLLMPLRNKVGGYSYARASDGLGMYYMPSTQAGQSPITMDSVTFAFRTGEVWSTDVGFLALDEHRLYYSDIEQTFVAALGRFRTFLRNLGVDGPYRWRAGLVGVRGRRLGYAPPPGRTWLGDAGPICAGDLVEKTGTIADNQTALEALLPFFESLFQECGVDRPNYLDQR